MSESNLLIEKVVSTGQYSKERDYWIEKLSGNLSKSIIWRDNDSVGRKRSLSKEIFSFSPKLSEKLVLAMNNSNSRLFILLVAGFLHFLKKVVNKNDLIIGIPIEKQAQRGNYINTFLPIRCNIRNDITFRELITLTRISIVEASQHQNYPIETLVDDLGLQVDLNTDFPFFDISVLFENIHDRRYIDDLTVNTIFCFGIDQYQLYC